MQGQLGQRLAAHPGSFRAGGWLWYVGVVLALAGILGGAKGVQALIGGDAGAMESLGTAACALALSPLVLIVPLLRWRQSVVVYEGGLVHARLFGSATIRRDEVAGVTLTHHRSRSSSHHEVEVRLRDGRVHSVTGIDGAEQLASYVSAWTAAPAVVPVAAGGWTPPGA